MKKSILTIIITLLVLSSVSFAANDRIDITVKRGGITSSVSMDQDAIIYQDRVLVPLRAICEALGCDVTWNAATQTAQIENHMTKMAVQINSYYIKKIDRETQETIRDIAIDVPAMIVNDRTLVPARAISEALYADVKWNAAKREVHITLEYDTGDFYEGMAEVYKDGKRGFINENRELVVPIEYDMVERYINGIARVKKDKQWFIIDKSGNKISGAFDSMYNFGNYVLAGRNEKLGVLNSNGDTIVPFEYDSDSYVMTHGYSDNFKDGYFILSKNNKYGVVDKNNNVIIPFNHSMVYGSIPSGIFLTERVNGVTDNNYYFVNAQGEKIINQGFFDAHPFNDGVAAVRGNNEGWGFINTEGEIVIPTKYSGVHDSYFIDDHINILGVYDNNDNIIWFDKNGNKILK